MTKSQAYVFMVIMMAMTVVGGMLSSYSSAHAGPPERPERPIMPIMPKPPEPPEPPELPIMAERTSDYIRIQPETVAISVPKAVVEVAANEYHYRNNNRESNMLLMWSLLLSISIVIAYFWTERKVK